MGLFFLPLLELKPNAIASGVTFNLLELQGDARYVILFALALVPAVFAFRDEDETRGWLLALCGNLLIILALLIPSFAGQELLDNVESIIPEGERIRNPRVLPSAAIFVAVFGGYVTLFAGLRDLQIMKATSATRNALSWGGLLIVVLMFLGGQMDIYSVMVEFNTRGDLLGQRITEHVTFVSIALFAGFVIGIGLGLWASRSENVAPVILYAVGIIQTIPSLALFGLLLVPLARLGDQLFTDVTAFFVVSILIAGGFIAVFALMQQRLAPIARTTLLILSAFILAIPVSLFTIVFVSFLFRITILSLTDAQFARLNNIFLLTLFLNLGLLLLRRFADLETKGLRYLTYVQIGGVLISVVALIVALTDAASFFLRNVDSVQELTIRDLGVSGIGTAPALIALALYSLLPLVRNTYAGLNNVDAAIIDSGRGMGMTPAQIFFQIELPLAFPVIMAGVRNAGVALVGIATIATIIGAGGLGDFVMQGIVNTSIDRILLGTIPAILLALFLDGSLRLIESLLTSPGIRQTVEL